MCYSDVNEYCLPMITDHNGTMGMLISFVPFQYQVLFPALWAVIEQIQASKVDQYYFDFYSKPAIHVCWEVQI